MKKRNLLIIFTLLLSLLIFSCKSTPVPYSFAEKNSETAGISFLRKTDENIVLIKYYDEKLPRPASSTYWDPISFPAGKKLQLRLLAEYQADYTSGTVLDIILMPIQIMRNFTEYVYMYCPPLDAGKSYNLTLRAGFLTIGRKLILTEAQTGDVVYEQAF